VLFRSREAGAVARLVNAAETAQVKARLGGGSAFSTASQRTIMAIRALQVDMDAQGEGAALQAA
jgi:hypothetical protein